MNRKPLLDPMPITKAFVQMHVKSDREKIRHNSADDHGLAAQGFYYLVADNDILHPAAGWISAPGRTRTMGDWHCRYVQPTREIVKACEPLCCEGRIGSFEIKRWKDPERILLFFTDSTMIAKYIVCELTAETLFQKIVMAGIEFDHHESDLYVKNSTVVHEILEKFPMNATNARPFKSEIDGEMWLDVPFAYEPFWIRKAGTL